MKLTIKEAVSVITLRDLGYGVKDIAAKLDVSSVDVLYILRLYKMATENAA